VNSNLGLGLLVVVMLAGVVEGLGSNLAAVSVKKEWVPRVYEGDAATELAFVNTSMSNIDLLAEMLGPVVGGLLLQFLDAEPGFIAVGGLNILSFVPEVGLLYLVYLSCPRLQLREIPSKEADDATNGSFGAWMVWAKHPSGLQLLTLSYASLYFTALAPHGVVLNAYLKIAGLSPGLIGGFRGAGAVAGVLGVTLFGVLRMANKRPSFDQRADVAETVVIPELRGLNVRFVGLQTMSVLIAAVAFTLQDQEVALDSSVPGGKVMGGMNAGILVFALAICVSRVGLYGFDVGLLELEQLVVDERFRSAAGSVEAALCALAELGVYLLSVFLPDPRDFGVQVWASVSMVSLSLVLYSAWLCRYHTHGHTHLGATDDAHDHTSQQLKSAARNSDGMMMSGGGVPQPKAATTS